MLVKLDSWMDLSVEKKRELEAASEAKSLEVLLPSLPENASLELLNHTLSSLYSTITNTSNPFQNTTILIQDYSINQSPPSNLSSFHSAVGGTFDYLHNGHKLLLSIAALVSTHLTVGVFDYSLDHTRLQKKQFYTLMQPLQERINNVSQFLSHFSPSLSFNVVPITDSFGPAILPHINALIGTKETESGCEAVNKERLRLGIEELKIFIVGLVDSENSSKLSSSHLRQIIANRQ